MADPDDAPSAAELSADEVLDRPIKYLVTTARGEFVIELPPSYKLTFGAVNPGQGPVGSRDLHCLRIWERYSGSKSDRLRAVFCDVRGFRDLSLPLARKIETQTASAQWQRDDFGNFEGTDRRQIETSWTEEVIPFEAGRDDDPF